ncbi:tetratricopeptide repeat-containing sensor histidine kinase [Bernardetia litoralis]|nr:tetratricopeptide repeat-containing sensor histidine kinase [Bernardetia litoralis]
MKKYVPLFLSLITSFIYSQEVKGQYSTIVQVDSLNQLAEKLIKSKPDSALFFIEKAEKLASSISYQLGKGIALKHKAYAISGKGNYSKSLNIIEQAIFKLEKTSNKLDLGSAYTHRGYLKERLGYIDKALENYTKSILIIKSKTDSDISFPLAISYNVLGGYYQRRGNYVKSLKYFNEALVLSEEEKEVTFTSTCLNNIGNIHLFQKEYEKAIPYYKKAILLRKKVDDRKGLASVYNNLGGTLLSQNKNEEALFYLKKASLIYKETNNTRGYLMSQINIGLIHFNREEYNKAKEYFKECLQLEQRVTDKNTLSMIYTNLAACHSEQRKYDSAILYAQKGLKVAKAINSKKIISDNLLSLSLSYEAMENFEEAYNYHVLYTSYKDSLFNIEKTSEINALLLDQKNLENTQLEKDNLLKSHALQKEQFERKTKEQEFSLLEKQAEADHLLALAKETKNRQESDSLYRAAKNAQLEADNLKIKAEKIDAQRRANQAESEQKIAFQRNLSILFGVIVLAAIAITFTAYRNQRNKQKANFLLAEKNEEINLQNELLEDSNQTKDRLFSIIAHDLRSPMMAFQDVSRQLEFYIQKQDSEKLLRTVKLLDTSSNNLTNLLNNLLHWSLLQQKQQVRYRFDTYSLQLLISEIIITYQTISEPKQIEWQVNIPTSFFVWVDAPSFQTIMRNIISNAIKFSPIKGKLVIQAIQKENLINLSIQDTGAGIPLEVQQNVSQNILNPTQKGTKNEKGTGLGLLLCYEFAKENNITINLDSTPQTGTLFTFTIPTQKKQ